MLKIRLKLIANKIAVDTLHFKGAGIYGIYGKNNKLFFTDNDLSILADILEKKYHIELITTQMDFFIVIPEYFDLIVRKKILDRINRDWVLGIIN